MQKLPEVSNRKRRWCMRKRKKPFSLDKGDHIFVAASHQTRLDTRSKARRPIKVGIKGRGRSGRSRDSNPACQCCSSAHLVQCEPDEASSFTNPNVGPGTYASLRLKLDAWSSAVQRGQKCSSPTRRLPSRSWGPIRPRVCSWFRAPIRHECQTAQLKSRGRAWQRGPYYLSLSDSDQWIDNLLLACLGTTHTSLDVASVSLFHPVAALSRSALC